MANYRLLLFFLCGFVLFPFKSKNTEITFLDVGQGDGIYLNTGEDIMIDGGSSSSRHVGENTIEPFLMSQGIDSLEKVFITHADADHTSGILYLAESGRIRICDLYLPYCAKNHEKYKDLLNISCNVHYIGAGDCIPLKKGALTCLSPDKGISVSEDTNEHSLILCYQEDAFSSLFTGDAGKESEKTMLKSGSDKSTRIPEDLTVLKAGHHGSSTSTSAELLDACTPRICVLSYGENNRYGHPHPETLDILSEYGVPHLDTARSGAVTFYTNGHSVEIYEFLSP